MSTPTSTMAGPPPSPSPWLHALVANVQDAIVLLDANGQVTYESPSACEILGIPPDDVLGAFGIGRIHPDERDAVIQSFERTIAVPGSVARATYRFERADGSWRHLEALAKNLLDDPDLRGVLITFRDVTERIQALEAAERAARSRDQFVARMGNELRTPLGEIIGWAQQAASHGSPIVDSLERISATASQLLRLIDEALELAAVQDGRLDLEATRIDLRSVVAEAAERVERLASQRDVVLHLPPPQADESVALADHARLRQVLVNLLSNAIRFNRYGGEVVIGWETMATQQVRLSVSDTGPGMPPAMLDRVFDRFERLGMTEAGMEGSGLGLAFANRIVELMNGTMSVENHPGRGATFRIDLPAA
ncbi:MAG: PAS domain S-box protein [Gemmatimonas sp.]|nr:PAS domain S-box protein [Gemmatimonas sp.]